MGLFSVAKKEHIVAIFDIGSGSIGGAITSIPQDPHGVPTIVNATRVDIAVRQTFDFNAFIFDMQKAFSVVADTLALENGGQGFNEIVCVLASPWHVTETRVVKSSRPRSFLFTKRIADELLQKEISLLADVYQKKYTTSDGIPELIEHHVMGVSLNGYPLGEPLGKRTKSVEMNMIVSLSPKVYLDMMRKIIKERFHDTPIRFSSFVVASFLAVRDKYVSPDSYMLVDIGGEITDVAIVSKGILKASVSFPFGRNTLFKSVCTSYNITMRDAQELFALWSTDTLEASRKNKIDPFFASIANSWGASLRESIKALPQTLSLPSTIFLTADNDVVGWFSQIISNEAYIQSLSGQKCTVVTLEGPDFLSLCNFKEGHCDPFLMIEALSVMRKKVPLKV